MEWYDEQVQIVFPVSCILIITVSCQSLCTSSSASGNLQQERRSSSLKVQAWSHIIPAEINQVPKKFGAAQTHAGLQTGMCKGGQYFVNWASWYEICKQQMPWAGSWRGRNGTRSAGHGGLQSTVLSPRAEGGGAVLIPQHRGWGSGSLLCLCSAVPAFL